MRKCKITAVVVTYNRKELLLECLESLEKQRANPIEIMKFMGEDSGKTTEQGGFDFQILVVDNASKDGTKEYIDPLLERHPEKMSYCRLEQNQGGAGGFSYGIKRAVEGGADYVWIMDDDTIVQEKTLEEMIKAISLVEDNFGFLSSEVRWTDGTLCKMNHQQILEVGAGQKELAEQGILPVRAATFVSLLFSAEAIKKVGLPLKEYFIWGDDKEYTLRLSKEFPCYMVSKSQVVHKMRENKGSSISKDDLKRIDRYYYAYRNDLCTAKRQGIKDVIIYYLAYWLNVLRVVLYSKDGKGARLQVMKKGKRDGKTFFPEVEYIDNNRN